MRLPSKPTADLWSDLKWSSGRLTETGNKNQPLEVKEAPKRPGLYRMTWDGETDWSLVLKSLLVKSSLRVADRQLEFDNLPPPVLLTIGKTTDIYKRLREHFGTNPNNNRVVKRLGDLIPKPIYPGLLKIAERSLLIEWVEIEEWVNRCLLERYGAAIGHPILDLEAEH